MTRNGDRVLVTGGASFIGSHLVDDFVSEGATVRVADDFSSGEQENPAAVSEEIEAVEGNLKVTQFAGRATRDIGTEFHLAADCGGWGYIANYPANCATSMALDSIVYEAAAQNGVDKITFASSACTYPTDIQQENPSIHCTGSMQRLSGIWTTEIKNTYGNLRRRTSTSDISATI